MNFNIKSTDPPIGNGGGTCKTLEDVIAFCRTSLPIIEIGSITQDPRLGNEGNTFHDGKAFTLNSLGLPNGGLPYYEKHLAKMTELIQNAGKTSIVNIAAFTSDEYTDLTRFAFENGADYVVENYGCPNVWVDREQKGILSYDFEAFKKTTIEIFHVNDAQAVQGRIGIKLSLLYPADIIKISKYLNDLAKTPQCAYIRFVTTMNTVPNCYEEEACESVITPAEGLAGMAGPAIGPIARGQVRQLRKLLHERISIIGVGGISTGEDAAKMLECGATFVQVVSAYYKNHDLGTFEHIAAEYMSAKEQPIQA
jgi:dihydroorotate dehydrogenase (fumarate)